MHYLKSLYSGYYVAYMCGSCPSLQCVCALSCLVWFKLPCAFRRKNRTRMKNAKKKAEVKKILTLSIVNFAIGHRGVPVVLLVAVVSDCDTKDRMTQRNVVLNWRRSSQSLAINHLVKFQVLNSFWWRHYCYLTWICRILLRRSRNRKLSKWHQYVFL